MAATKFRLYKDALRHLADARLAVITDDVESRYALDDAYAQGVEFVMRQAPWRFALKTIYLVPENTEALPGFLHTYEKPNDWLRTHALFVQNSDGRERPLDIREQDDRFFANLKGGVIRYISSDFLDPARFPWPEHFAQAVGAYLAFLVADRVTGEHGAAGRMSQLFSSLLGSAVEHDALPEDPWLQYQLEGAYARCMPAVIVRGWWKFALKTVQLTAPDGQTDAPNDFAFPYPYNHPLPEDWVQTHALYVGTERERPFDIREYERQWHTATPVFYARYLSRNAFDASLWPESLAKAVHAYLELDSVGEVEAGAQGRGDPMTGRAAMFQAALGAALENDSLPEDPWLEFQLSGDYARCMPAVINRGWWRFALKTAQFNANVIDQPGGQTSTVFDFVYPYVFDIPDDWVQTHALFVPWNAAECPFDIKEHQHRWQTATPLFLARYLTTAAYDATLWPESLAKAVHAYLELNEDEEPGEMPAQGKGDATAGKAALYQAALAMALDDESDPPSPWLRHQLSAQFLQCTRWVLEQARWRFAIRSVVLNENYDPLPGDTIDEDGRAVTAHGYAHRFIKPGDWLRTIWFGRQVSEGLGMIHIDTDYIDEGYVLYANWNPLELRYLSVERGLDPTQWTAHFRDALLAYLEHIEARGDPKMEKFAAERFKFFQLQLREAESNDDSRDGPVYRNIGRIVRGRFGWGRGYGIGPGYGSSQGWWG